MHLKRKKCLTADPNEGREDRALSQVVEAEEGDEEVETLFVQKERKAAVPLKRNQTNPDSTSTSQKTKVRILDACYFSLTSILVFVLNCVDHCRWAKGRVLLRQESG